MCVPGGAFQQGFTIGQGRKPELPIFGNEITMQMRWLNIVRAKPGKRHGRSFNRERQQIGFIPLFAANFANII